MASTVTTHRDREQTRVDKLKRHDNTVSRCLSCTGHAWVCGRDDGTEEEAVRVVELVSQLSDHLHQLHHAVHQVPVGEQPAGQQAKDDKAAWGFQI